MAIYTILCFVFYMHAVHTLMLFAPHFITYEHCLKSLFRSENYILQNAPNILKAYASFCWYVVGVYRRQRVFLFFPAAV